MKNSSDTIGNGTRDLPVCSAVLKPTAPPRTPSTIVQYKKSKPGKIQYKTLNEESVPAMNPRTKAASLSTTD